MDGVLLSTPIDMFEHFVLGLSWFETAAPHTSVAGHYLQRTRICILYSWPSFC